MRHNFMLCARAMRKGQFTAEPGPSRYLKVPQGRVPEPAHAITRNQWVNELREAATWGTDARRNDHARGDILVFVHGYNNDLAIIHKRHAQLQKDLHAAGFRGVLLTYCWPSDDKAIGYLEDRHDAKRGAMQLVSDGIKLLAAHQTPECTINIHVLAHSTGAYVVREAFDDADDTALPNNAWMVSQVAFIGGDVSANSLAAGNATTESLYRHCYRLTNYYSKHDSALKLSNAKRVGIAPRVGRVGLPAKVPAKAVNVDCSEYFHQLNSNAAIRATDQRITLGSFDHSWYIGNQVFIEDLFATLKGDLDRAVIATRRAEEDGRFVLVRGSGS